MDRSKVGPSSSKWLSQDSMKSQGRISSHVSPAVILGDFRVFTGGPFCALPPQSLDLHNSRSLHLLSTSAVYSPGHTRGHDLVITWVSSTLTSQTVVILWPPLPSFYTSHPHLLFVLIKISIPYTSNFHPSFTHFLSYQLPILQSITSISLLSVLLLPNLSFRTTHTTNTLHTGSVWLSTFSVPSLDCQGLLGTFTHCWLGHQKLMVQYLHYLC